jgi:DNA-binding NtrC family response regulator
MKRLLIVEDNSTLRETIFDYFSMKGEFVKSTDSVSGALNLLKKHNFEIIITDLNLRDKSGIELIKIVKSAKKNIEIIVITGISSIDVAIEAIKSGAFQYLMKPFKLDELEIFIEKAYEKLGLEKEVKRLKENLIDRHSFENIISVSSEMETIFEKVKQIAPTDANVLITGESGVGKELVAKSIHYNSLRRDGPFIPINCSALPDTLLESELFGYEKGAFTGAAASKKGKFQLAEGGTLFLDEIGDLSLFTQVKLLRFLETKEIMTIGGITVKKIDTRLIFATNKDLEKAISRGEFREDFYYRIKVVNIDIPPLRQRPIDIYPLLNYYMIKFCRDYKKPLMQFSKDAVDLLKQYSWQGNVRELKNTVEHIVVFNNKNAIEVDDLPKNNESRKKSSREKIGLNELSGLSLAEVERIAMVENLKRYNNNHTKVAEILGISRATLIKKIKEYNIKEEK